ncbi:MAG: AI-2E family transporter [Clostridia bacterium]|nr:AI-2E family transporter [Clostridia bacterium]
MEKTRLGKKWIIGGVFYAVLLFLILYVSNLSAINAFLGKVWLILRPVVVGLVFAYILNPFFNFFEKRIFCRFHPPALRRGLSLLFSYIAIIALIVCLFWLILPQLIDSLVSLFRNHEAYIDSMASYLNGFISPINKFLAQWTNKDATIAYVNADGIMKWFSGFLDSMEFGKEGGLLSEDNINLITTVVGDAVSIVADVIFAIFISLYYLVSKEKRVAQVMRMRNALFSDKVNGRISRVVGTLDHSFGGFVKGKVLEGILIWIISYVTFLIFDIPFAILISAFIAVLNIIPAIGIIVGAVPSAIIVLLTEPAKFLPFLIIVILIQQIEGNILGPKILGDNIGVSSLCVVIAISTMGNLWGLVGMILGVPIFASILKIGDYYTEKRLQAKGLPSEIESYYPTDALVDPVKDSHRTTDKMVKRLEKNVLRIRRELLSKKKDELTRHDRSMLRIYRFARKYKLLSDISDETVVQYSAQQYHEQILQEADHRYEKQTRASKDQSTENQA